MSCRKWSIVTKWLRFNMISIFLSLCLLGFISTGYSAPFGYMLDIDREGFTMLDLADGSTIWLDSDFFIQSGVYDPLVVAATSDKHKTYLDDYNDADIDHVG